MPDQIGVSQETFDRINAEYLTETQDNQEQTIMEGAAQEAPPAPEAPVPAPASSFEEAPAEEPAEEDTGERAAGKEGTVRTNPLQGVMDAIGGAADALADNMEGGRVNVLDFVDNVFQGDQKTKEEIAAERETQREEGAARMKAGAEAAIERDPVGAAVADTLVRAVPGGAIDAVEDALGAAEVIGDTVKTFATLGNVNESDNVFSSNYDWAQWKLGADEIGAQTAVGQFAQELVSFAAIGSRLGAFKSFGGGLTATTKLGRLGQAAKAGAIEAGYGMAADAIKGLAGEGNFANMLEQLVPGLKDTWVTALSIDEDDNPWEAAVKSALDGAAIGFPVGVIGAMASGARAAKNVDAAAIKANPRAAEEAYLEKFTEVLEQTELKLGDTSVRKLTAEDVFMEASDGDLSRLGQLDATEIKKLRNDYDLGAFLADEKGFFDALSPAVQKEVFGSSVTKKTLKNGTTIEWSLSDMPGDEITPDSVRIDWDLSKADAEAGGLGEGAGGTEMFKQVREVLKDNNIQPGTIISTQAAADGAGFKGLSDSQSRTTAKVKKQRLDEAKAIFIERNQEKIQEVFDGDGEAAWDLIGDAGQSKFLKDVDKEGLLTTREPNMRRDLYERAGFSAPRPKLNDRGSDTGEMFAVVRTDKKGRRVLEPLDIEGDIAAQVAKATESSMVQGKLPALEVIENRVAAQVPVYWDDVAAEFPQAFTPGTRVIENPEFPPEVLKALRDPGEGVTVHPFTGEVPETGTMVAIDGKSLTSFEPEDIADFIAQNYDILTREDAYLGAWVSEITGKPVVEISRRVESHDLAMQMGKAFDQEGVFRMSDFSYHDTGGIDRLKETQGFHMKSAYTTKNYVRTPGDAQSIAAKQFTPGAPNGAIGGRIMTDEQLHIIGDGLSEYASGQLDDVIRGMDVKFDDVVADSRISRAELQERVSYDLADFIDASGKIDLQGLPTMKYGDDSILTREGALQTRILIQNVAGTIWDEARMIVMKDGQTIDTSANIEVMVDGLKALARLRKKTVNIFGVRLADEGMPLQRAGLFETVFNPKKAAEKTEQAKLFNLQDQQMDEVEKALDQMVEGIKSGDRKRMRQAMRTAEMLQLTGGDPVKMARVSRGIPQLYGDVALKHMYNSLLSSPATHLVNNLSNFTNTLARPIQAALGGQPRAALASVYNFGEMLSESFDLAGRTWSGENAAQGAKVASAGEVRIALDSLAEKVSLGNATNAEKINSGILHMLYDMAEWPVLAWPSRFLTTSDEFFKAMNARMEYRVQNYMEASNFADGDPQELFEQLMVKNKDLAFGKKSGQVMDSSLLDVAQELTFQTKLSGPAGRFAAFVEENPLLRPFFPFVKTGHNIMVFTGTHTPILNMALGESRRALRGELGPYAQAVHRGRLAMGTMTMAAAGMALAADRLTGAGPAEKNAREAWLRTHQPRSLKIGDTWYSYDRLEPFGQILSAVADIHYGLTTGELEHDRAAYRVNYLIYALSTNFSDKTFFQGVKDLATLLNPSGPGVLNRLQTIVLGTANNFLPSAGLRRAAFNTMTPYMQEYHKPGVDRIKQQMGLPVEPPADRTDFLDGTKLPAAQGGFLNAILPIKAVEKKTDNVREGLALIEFDQASIRKELGDIKLTPTQSNRLNELMSQTGLYDKLDAIISNPQWAVAVREHKEAFRNGTSNIPKERMLYYKSLTDEIRKAQKIALDFLLEEDPELRIAYLGNKQALQNAGMGQIEGLLTLPNR